MNNVSFIHDCYGCGVCAIACAKRSIKIVLNESGFYEPLVDLESCVNCGQCLKVCSFNNEYVQESSPINCYESWSEDETIRKNASSGGVGFEIARRCFRQGYQTFLVRYNTEKARAEHFIATDENSLSMSMGSKYIQSYTLDAFRQIDLKKNNFIVGTPCQIASMRRWVRLRKIENKFLLMDFFCHGIPSALAWKNYLSIYKDKTGNMNSVSWRDKDKGWHDSWAMMLKGEKGDVHIRRSQGDLFYSIFLGGWCMNPACRKQCKFKYEKSAADIRIGDLWGRKYIHDDKGVSALVAFTEKGQKVISSLEGCTIISSTFDIVAEGQMKGNAKAAWLSPFVMRRLKKGKQLSLRQWHLMNRMEFYVHIPFLAWTKFRKRVLR